MLVTATELEPPGCSLGTGRVGPCPLRGLGGTAVSQRSRKAGELPVARGGAGGPAGHRVTVTGGGEDAEHKIAFREKC